MGLDDLISKAKSAISGNEDKVADGLDKAADMIKEHTDDATDAKIDTAVEKAKDMLDKE